MQKLREKYKKEYSSWLNAKTRCRNEKYHSYHRYGGRGILFTKEWDLFENFLRDMGPKPEPNFQLDRLDGDKCYNKQNCKWVSPKENVRHRSTTKLTAKNVTTIRIQFNSGDMTQEELAILYNVTKTYISMLVRKITWKDIC